MPLQFRRRGLALPIVLVLVGAALVITFFVHRYATDAYRRAYRGMYGTTAEILANSASEEAWYQIQRDINKPGTEIFRRFRPGAGGLVSSAPLPVSVPLLKQRMLDGKFGGYFASRFDPDESITVTAGVTYKNPYPNQAGYADAGGFIGSTSRAERVGVIHVVAEVRPSVSSDVGTYRKLTVEKAFRVAQVTPPAPFGQGGLVVMYPEYITNKATAQADFAPHNWQGELRDSVMGGKAILDQQFLGPVNDYVDRINQAGSEFERYYGKVLSSRPGSHSVAPPPEWLRNIQRDIGGVLSQVTKIKKDFSPGQQGGRPMFFDDAVLFARPGLEDLGSLGNFNYQAKIQKTLEPIMELIGKIQGLVDLNNRILEVTSTIHALVPYSGLEAGIIRCAICSVSQIFGALFCNGCGRDFMDFCEEIHEDMLDPVLRTLMGVGQALTLIQKVLMEVTVVGQNAFQVSMDQARAQLPGIPQMDMTGLPAVPDFTDFGATPRLPQFAMEDGLETGPAGNVAQRMEQLGQAAMGELLDYLQDQIQRQIIQKVSQAAVMIVAAAGLNAIPVGGWIASEAAGVIIREVNRQIRRLSRTMMRTLKTKSQGVAAFVTNELVAQLGFLQSNPVVAQLNLPGLISSVVMRTIENDDINGAVTDWLGQLQQKFTSEVTGAVGTDLAGGVLKGFVMRHMWRNAVIFDPHGAELFNRMRGLFEPAYREEVWRKKATWVISKPVHFNQLCDRYLIGKYNSTRGTVPDDEGSQGGSGQGIWNDQSYVPNTLDSGAYGVNGVIFYTGTEDLVIKFPDPANQYPAFRGKCVIYCTEADVRIDTCKLEDSRLDVLTVITKKDIHIESGGERAEISVHGVSSESKFHNPSKRGIFGNVVLKNLDVEENKSIEDSLQAEPMTYNPRLDAGSRDSPKETHLFVSVSPYELRQEYSLEDPN